jgi:hypothetical protein
MAYGMATWRSRGARAVYVCDGVVARSPAARWWLASDKVLPVSTGEAPGRRRAYSRGMKLTGKGSSVTRWRIGGGIPTTGSSHGGRRRGAHTGVSGGSGCFCSSEEEGRVEAPIDLKETTRGVSSHREAGEVWLQILRRR